MKKQFVILLCFFCVYFSFGQEITFQDGIAHVDGKPYVKIEKKSKRKYFIYDVKTNEKLLKITSESTFNRRNQNYDTYIKVYFSTLKKGLIIRDLTIHDEKEIIEFLHSEFLFKPNVAISPKTLLEDYKRLSIRAKCEKILKNDFTQIYNDYFISIVGKDTIAVNEVKYLCVYTAFYTKKAMFDRYGKWHKVVFPYEGSHRPNLIWNNIQLFNEIDKKFTVIARGYEGRRAMYASVIVLDEKGNDMLSKDAPYRTRITELFGNFIKENSKSKKFYKAYWTTFDPDHWKELQEYKRRKNTTRARSPFYEKRTQPRTVIRNEPKQ